MTSLSAIIPEETFDLGDVQILSIKINKKERTMHIDFEEKTILTKKQFDRIYKGLKTKYNLCNITFNLSPSQIVSEVDLKKTELEKNIIKKLENEREQSKKTNEVIIGTKIKGALLQIEDVTPEVGRCKTSGQIFAVEYRQRRDGAWIVTVDITNKKSSMTIKLFCDVPPRKSPNGEVWKEKGNSPSKEVVEKRLKKGTYISVYGDVVFDKYSNDYVMNAYSINEIPAPPVVEDNAPKKRVELHMHTQMSAMDGVSSATDLIARAASWGHSAIAITDHGVVQAYPEAAKAADKFGIKVIYGVEGYVVDDNVSIVTRPKNYSLKNKFIVFDLETTGLSAAKNEIIEIGAIKVEEGEIKDSFSTFVKPKKSIPDSVTGLTGITNAMVANAPSEEIAVAEFLKFCGNDSVLVAHNAGFDTSFIRAAMSRMNMEFSFSYIDTVSLSRKLLKELRSHKLNAVAKHLKIKLDNHHRAVDDALATAHIFIKFANMLSDDGVKDVIEINSHFSGEIDVKGAPSNHIIIIAKNPVGLENLYRLISASHIDYFYRTPRMPKSIINKFREGLIVGSACEAGELYSAVFSGKSDEDIAQIVSFYDFLEIQPLGNNEFMKRNGSADEQQLKDINIEIINLGKKYNKLVVATGDVHFLDPEDEVFRRVLMAGKGFDDADFQAPLYLRTTEEMLKEFSYLDEQTALDVVVENPNKIADMVEKLQPVRSGTYPPSIEGAQEDIIRMSYEKAEEIYGTPLPDIVKQRMDKELKSITTYGFSVMYIIAQKLVSKSLSDGYLVGSRGSVGSSFIAFLSGITEVNALPAHYVCPNCKHSDFTCNDGSGISGCDMPDKVCPVCNTLYKKDGHDIPFETFLGFAGDKEPDIDLNFSGEYQSVAHKYTEELFGEGHVFRAGTIGTIADKTAFGYAKKYFSERNKVVHEAEIRRIAIGCTGVKRTTGQHPGGVIIVPKANDIHQFCPIQHPADDPESTIVTTHFDYHSIHDNLLKLDILGHDDPTVIRMLEDLTGKDAKQIPLDDKETLSLFLNTDALGVTPEQIKSTVGTYGVPEFGTEFVRQMLIDTKPKTFSELLRISGLSHGTDVWLNNAQEYIRSGEIVLSEAICTRDDIMIYLIHMGLEPKTSFTIMEKVRKGKGLTAEDEEEMKKHEVPQWYIDSCNKIKYMFPKAHAVAYVMMAFRIAWFKVHIPLAYYCAYFTIRAEGAFDGEVMCYGIGKVIQAMTEIDALEKPTQKEKDMKTVLELCLEMYSRGFDFSKVDIYKSHAKKFLPDTDGEKLIRPPLSALPGISVAMAESIVEEREKGEFFSIEDLHARTKISKTALEILERNGCFDGMAQSSQMSILDMM